MALAPQTLVIFPVSRVPTGHCRQLCVLLLGEPHGKSGCDFSSVKLVQGEE